MYLLAKCERFSASLMYIFNALYCFFCAKQDYFANKSDKLMSHNILAYPFLWQQNSCTFRRQLDNPNSQADGRSLLQSLVEPIEAIHRM